MTSPQGNPARREPLLWLQLLGLAALPLEVAALLLVLAGADPGPLPGLERVFCWALGSLGPAVLFWKLPPDLWSLLLLQVPLRGRRPDQLRLSALQTALPLKLLGAAGAPLLLPLLWWADRAAGLAWSVSPFTTTPRALVLLLAAALLALMLWQWQQILQALWMFSRPAPQIAQTLPLSSNDAAERRLNLGLPLLLLAPLAEPEAPQERAAPTAAPSGEEAPAQAQQAQPETPAEAASQSQPPAEGSAEREAEPQPEPESKPEPEPTPEPSGEPVAVSPTEPEPPTEPEASRAGVQGSVQTVQKLEQSEPDSPAAEPSQSSAAEQAFERAAVKPAEVTPAPDQPAEAAAAAAADPEPAIEPEPESEPQPDWEPDSASPSPVADLGTSPIEPEKAAEQGESTDLDQQV